MHTESHTLHRNPDDLLLRFCKVLITIPDPLVLGGELVFLGLGALPSRGPQQLAELQTARPPAGPSVLWGK